MEKIATDTYSFRDVREGGYVFAFNLSDRQVEVVAS